MNKLKQLKLALKNPPPERLAKIEYRSHFLQLIGIMAVCIILINKDLWYIVFAFIFGTGISYSQGMTAFKRYEIIMSLVQPERVEDYDKDISPTRRRSKIIKSVMGNNAKWFSIILAVVFAVLFINPTLSRWLLMFLYPFTILIIFMFFYFFFFYWICFPIYKRRLRVK